MHIIETERLILRTWRDEDLAPMLAINQDPEVMAHFPRCQDLADTKRFIAMIKRHFDQYGYTLYACVKKERHAFIGFIGLLNVSFDAHFTPATEIGWRLSAANWGQGLATEGAKAVLAHAFSQLKIPEIVSFTAVANAKSINVMTKIGLVAAARSHFDHPALDKDSPLRRHVLYRLTQGEYLATTK